MSGARSLTPGELTELEQQRDYLLDSLGDLDAEHEAGDLADEDYQSLRDDYTRRTATVVRAIEAQKASVAVPTAETRSRARQRLFTVAGVLTVALLAGFLLARSVGFRSSNSTATGDVRGSTRSLILEAQELAGAGDFPAAIERYDDALEIQPSNAEALAYRAWFLYLSDDSEGVEAEVEAFLDDAIASQPTYADARVFRAVLLTNLERFDEATADLDAFDQSNPPPQMVELVVGQGLRERALFGRLGEADTSKVLLVDDYGTTAETMARAGRLALEAGDAGLAIRAYGAALESEPENITALLERGELLVLTGQQSLTAGSPDALDLIASGRASIDRAIELEPENFRAGVLLLQVTALEGDLAAFEAELAILNGLDLSDDEQRVVDALSAVTQGD